MSKINHRSFMEATALGVAGLALCPARVGLTETGKSCAAEFDVALKRSTRQMGRCLYRALPR